MILGILGDTHEDPGNAIPHIIAEFHKRGVEKIIHCGDMEPMHLNRELFGNLPVYCAVVDDQAEMREFKEASIDGWQFTWPNDRIIALNEHLRAYLGHKGSSGFLRNTEEAMRLDIQGIREKHDFVRYFFAGHTHHQIFMRDSIIDFINPGAVTESFDGYEFVVLDTATREIVFCRIPQTNPVKETFSVGVITDSLNVSDLDVNFWDNLAKEFRKRGVKSIIHIGNIAICDVGHKALKDFEVYYNLRSDQQLKAEVEIPPNWHNESPVVEINGYRFYVQLDLGADLLEQSEYGMHKLSLKLRKANPEISFILCGLTSYSFLEEGQEMKIINPGDTVRGRNFAVICLPRTEITFGHVPVDPLPPLK
jgi:predicted phosphodiesterase